MDKPIELKEIPANFLIDLGIGKLMQEIENMTLSELLDLKDASDILRQMVIEKILNQLPVEVRAHVSEDLGFRAPSETISRNLTRRIMGLPLDAREAFGIVNESDEISQAGPKR